MVHMSSLPTLFCHGANSQSFLKYYILLECGLQPKSAEGYGEEGLCKYCQTRPLYFGKSHDPISWDCLLYFSPRLPLTRILPKISLNLGKLYIRIHRWSRVSFSDTQTCSLTASVKLSPIQSCFHQHIVFRDLASYFLIQKTHSVEHPILDF